ncbi:hypothetical protein FOL47_005432 [Perkinsus chesapeaki]|uniref:Uncharacterized protein n=1 Tax=Perkinsus chesapeaki TaxID=330153 RepID=A0A7J6MYN2_PERCH|nr:hypothetical protein FOL47_005432 [Perkinsus chesapeaki]
MPLLPFSTLARRSLSTSVINPLMSSSFGATCPLPSFSTSSCLTEDVDELHQIYADLLLGPDLAFPGVEADASVTIGRSKAEVLESLFPSEWSDGVARFGHGPYQYPQDPTDEERVFDFVQEAITKERPGVLLLGPLSEPGDRLASCEYTTFVEAAISHARGVRPETKVIWDETIGGFGRVAGARPQLWSIEFFLKNLTWDAALLPSLYGPDSGIVAGIINHDYSDSASDSDPPPTFDILNREIHGLRYLLHGGISLPTSSAYIGGYIHNRLWNELLGRSRVVVDVHGRGAWIAIEVLHDEVPSRLLPLCCRLVKRPDHDVIVICPPFAFEDPQEALLYADELVQSILDLLLFRES